MLDTLSADLQKEFPGLKGFLPGNLKKIWLFAEAYFPHFVFGSTLLNKITPDRDSDFSIRSSRSSLIETNGFYTAFLSISFSHHFTIIAKIKT